ncbi:MAG: isochorismate synthase [Chlorobiaceae bacterium]|nr:isochorismate synthase [Chlorobiaceae bacterium]NTV59716.1 isochorismate synthase [Chlorobiaceae bacterium]
MSERYNIITPSAPPLPFDKAVSSLKSALVRYERDTASQGNLPGRTLVVFSQAVDPLDLKGWLGNQTVFPRIYWMNRENDFAVAGIGSADTIQFDGNGDNASSYRKFDLKISEKNPEARYFGGFRFNNLETQDQIWKEFSSCFLVLPLVQLSFENNAYRLSCHLWSEEKNDIGRKISELIKTIDQINPHTGYPSLKLPELVKLCYNPDEKNWQDTCRKALETFESGEMEKIALARQTVLEFKNSFSPFLFMLRYPSQKNSIYNFYFEPSENNAFFSFSPERLYRRNNDLLLTEALAGTCSKETINGDSLDVSEILLNSEKDIREHKFVKDMIYHELLEVSSDIQMEENVQVLQLNRLAHLYTRCSAKLKPEFENDSAVLTTLHPTPAVGGVPREPAMQHIMELEPFSRGWYAAPAGWISRDAAEFSVAIRSALVSGNHAYLYSGAGLVKGSDPLSEWEEVDQKIGDLLAITRQEV